MTPHIVQLFGDNAPTAKLYYGEDVRVALRALPESSVHMVATSPPYWGLRKYLPEGMMMLRKDLSVEQLAYVKEELCKAGLGP